MAADGFNEDIPESLVDQAIALPDREDANARYDEEWDELIVKRPHVRDAIARLCFQIAPGQDQLELRQRASRSFIGFYMMLEQARQVDELNQMFAQPSATKDQPAN